MYLRSFTFLDRATVEALETATKDRPEKREAQVALARHMTALVHGEDEMLRAERAAGALFTEAIAGLDEQTLLEVFAETPSVTQGRSVLETGAFELSAALEATGLVKSKSEGRRAIEQGGVYVNNRKTSPEATVSVADLLHDRYLVLRRGKRDHALVRFD